MRRSPVKKVELSLKTKFTSFGQKKEIDNIQKEKTVREYFSLRNNWWS